MTASEQIYQSWLQADNEEDAAFFEGQLAAICIVACRKKRLTPPFSYRERIVYRKVAVRPNLRGPSAYTLSDVKRSESTDPNPFWRARFLSLPPWVRRWVKDELQREICLRDGGRYIGRRCVFALIDEIRSYQRRRCGAKTRVRNQNEDPEEVEYLRAGMLKVLAEAGLPGKLRIRKDKQLLERLMAAYPLKLSNVSIALEVGVSEGAIRKRRKRISQVCFGLANGNYPLGSVLKALGLKEGTKKRP